MNALAKHQEQHIVPAQDAPMVAMIERIAMDPTIPLDRLEKMLEMKERMEDRAREAEEREAKKAYFAAMSLCQKELPVVARSRENKHTRSSYADLADIEKQAMPIIHGHGFGVTFQPDGYNDKGELLIRWEITHEEGHSRNGIAGIPVDGAGMRGNDNKTGTQAFGSTATYGRRYLLCMLFNISTGDDTDGNTTREQDEPKFISADQVKRILSLLEETNSDIQKFCEVGKINAVPEMPARQFDSAIQMLEKKKTRIAGGAA